MSKTFESVNLIGESPRVFFGDLLSMSTAKKGHLNNLADYKRSYGAILTAFGGFHMDMVAAQASIFKYVFCYGFFV
jgi:hypothetical protein